MYLSLSEKKAYIDKDFKNRVMIPLGELPADRSEAQAYIRKLMQYAEMWGERYRRNALGLYALEVFDDYVDTIEKHMHRIYGGIEP